MPTIALTRVGWIIVGDNGPWSAERFATKWQALLYLERFRPELTELLWRRLLS